MHSSRFLLPPPLSSPWSFSFGTPHVTSNRPSWNGISVARPMRRHRDGSIINHFIQPCAHAVFTNHIAASGQEFGIIAYLEPIQYDHIHVEVHRP